MSCFAVTIEVISLYIDNFECIILDYEIYLLAMGNNGVAVIGESIKN